MIPDESSEAILSDAGFQEALVNCLERLEQGESLGRERLEALFPQYAAALHSFIEDQDVFRQVASQIRDSRSGVQPTQRTVPPIDETMDSNPKGSDFTAGDRIRYIGEYEILSEIARGGMGIVFKARQQKLNRVVALKMILSGKLADATDVERFHREAQAAGRLKHPCIVPVHDVGEHEGRHYFTMDFVDGRSLAEELREESLAPRRAAALLRTVADAVHFAHQQGTVHRDLKPANILLTADGAPHVTDFGLAKIMDAVDEDSRAELTASGQILGTPSYMSPEQASGKQQLVSPASDIYSLGAILYASLTGRAPFVADSPVDTLLQVMRNEPVAPRTLNPSIPRDLETVCLKCLTKEPHKRYGTAKELADDLQRFLDGRPVIARPIGPIAKTWRVAKRNPAIASLVVLVLILLVGGTTISSYFAIEADRRADLEQQQRRRADQQAELATMAESNAKKALRKEKLAHQTAEIARARTVAAMSAEKEARQRAEQALDAEAEARAAAESARRTADWQAYVARMQQVMHVAEGREFGHLDRLLGEVEPTKGETDLRGWEWYYYRDGVRQATTSLSAESKFHDFAMNPAEPDQLTTMVEGHIETWDWTGRQRLSASSELPIQGWTCPAISPDGELLAYGHHSGQVAIYDLQKHSIVQVIDAHTSHLAGRHVVGIVWNPAGNGTFASACWAGDVKVWDAKTGSLVRTIVEREPVKDIQSYSLLRTDSLDWHLESGLASGHRWGHFKVWDAETGELRWQGRYTKEGISRMKWSPSGALLLANEAVWTNEGEQLTTLPLPIPDSGTAVAWRDEDTIACGVGHDIVLINVASCEVESRLNVHSGRISTLAFATDGELLSRADDGEIRKTAMSESSAIAQRTSTGNGFIFGVAWSPDDKRIAIARKNTNKIFILDANSFETVHELTHSAPHHANDVRWSIDGEYIVGLAFDGVLNVWNAFSGELIESIATGTYHYSGMGFNHRGDRLAICGAKEAEIYTFPELKRELRLPHVGFCRPVFNADDSKLIVNPASGLKIFAVADGSLLKKSPIYPGFLAGGDISEAAGLYATAGKEIRLLDTRTFAPKATLGEHRGRVNDVRFSPDGKRLATAGSDGKVRIWDITTLDEVVALSEVRGRAFNRVAWSHDGRRLLAGTDQGEIYCFGSQEMPDRFRDEDSAGQAATSHGSPPNVESLDWSPDGRHLVASDGKDGQTSVENGKPSAEVRIGGSTQIVPPFEEAIMLNTPIAQALSTRERNREAIPEDKSMTRVDRSILDDLNAESDERRLTALQALAEQRADATDAVPRLIELLDQPDSIEKAWAVHCLGRIGRAAAAAAPKLHEILKANGEGEYKDAKAVPSLSLLMHGRPSVKTIRFGAAAALVRMGPAGEVAIPTLIEMLKNPGESVKTYRKPRKLGSPEAEGYAALLYRSDDQGTYTDARDQYLAFLIGSLAMFGPAAKDAVPAIEAVKNNPDTLPIVREMAEDAIERISADGTEVTEDPGS